ncbi:MAG TPA: acetyl-CoA carboxylase biotin carboxyl carrier protein [Terriglobales bacterium]|nr:acetyl-CoA carboxylase biotin carboxyl carrier protein [Terriglobales bacterium]
MNQKEIKELIEFLIEKDIAEFELERGDVKLKVKRAGIQSAPHVVTVAAPVPIAATPVMAPVTSAPVAVPQAVAPSAPAPAAAVPAPAAGEDESSWLLVKSPIVGTFYGAPSPGAPPFVKVGDKVSVGQVLCIVEAMKLMNEIESDHAGTIVKCYASNGQPVEYGQKLFAVKA